MSIRIPWDEHETAILISACVDYNAGKCTKKEAIKNVSRILRKRAEESGIEIDEVFRNENGITMQFMLVNELITQEKCGLRGASKLFVSMVEMYKNDRTKFQEILMEARKTMEANKINQEQFTAWLSGRLSPAQMSEIYITYYDIDKYLQDEKILEVPLLETIDIKKIESIKKMITTNGKFRFIHRSKIEKYSKAIGFYHTWLSEWCKESEGFEKTIDKSVEEKSLEENKQLDILDECDEIKIVKFGAGELYPFTKVEYFEYFGKRYESIGSWKKLYVEVLQCLVKDYPNEINNLKGKSLGSGTRIDIGNWEHSLTMTAPRMFEKNLYVETNLNATNILGKIKHLLDVCRVDVDKLVVAYSMKDNEQKEVAAENSKKTEVDEPQLTDAERIIVSADNTESVEKINEWNLRTFLEEHNLEYVNKTSKGGCLWVIGGREIQSLMMQCWSHGVSFRFRENGGNVTEGKSAWWAKLSDEQFKSWEHTCESNECSCAVVEELDAERVPMNEEEEQLALILKDESSDDVDFDKYQEILSNEYNKGFRLNDKLSLKRLRVQWQRYYNEEIKYDDEIICRHIAHITIRHGDMAYLPQSLLDEDTKGRLLSYIETTFESGKEVIYYEALYKEFAGAFSSHRINNVEMLKTYLSYINDGSMYLNRSYIAVSRNVTVDHVDEVRSYMISYGSAIAFDELATALSHLPEDKIKWIISGNNSKEFVWNKKGEFLHADVVELSQYELDLITEWISLSIADKDYMGGKELVDTIRQKLPAIMERYPFLTEYGLRDAIAYKLQDAFSFKGKIISALGQDLSMEKVFADYTRSNPYFTLTQLNSLKNELNTPIYFDAVYQNSLRINKEDFVSQEQAKFDISATDSSIDRFCQGEYVAIKEISLFGAFPDAGFPWNEFLLQHYVANYSKNYKLLHAGFTAGYAVGAIVKRTSQLNTFEEVITKALADSGIALNSEDALQYLSDSGFLARRSFGNIETVLVKANQQRLNKGD